MLSFAGCFIISVYYSSLDYAFQRAMREKLERKKNGGGVGAGTVIFTLAALAAIGAAGFFAWKRYEQQ